MWEKIKNLFGFGSKTKDKDIIEEINEYYKVEPKKIKFSFELKDELSKDKIVNAHDKEKVKKLKEKRNWMNNGKEQKLLTISEQMKLDDTWKKGKLSKKTKHRILF